MTAHDCVHDAAATTPAAHSNRTTERTASDPLTWLVPGSTGKKPLDPSRHQPGPDLDHVADDLEDVFVAVPMFLDQLCGDAVEQVIEGEGDDDDVVQLAHAGNHVGDDVDRRHQVAE